MKATLLTIVAGLALVAALGSSATEAAPQPGFPAGTWIGTGTLIGKTETVGDIIIISSGTLKFTLTVSKDGKVGGKGTWRVKQTGSGSVGSKIVGVSTVTFSGTPTNVRYKGIQVITTQFVDGAHNDGNTFTRKEPITGGLVIKKALSCLVTGGHAFAGGKFTWKASLRAVTCSR